MLRVSHIFYLTFRYWLASFKPDADILKIKKQWALDVLSYMGFEMESRGTPPATEGPLILVGNHISYVDIIVLMAAHPRVVFVAKKEISYWPVIGPSATRVGTVFVNRGSKKHRQDVRRQIAEQLLSKNSHVAIFPSGTTTLKEELQWKKGAFEIAKQNSIPVKLFKVTYSHPREVAYVDDDTLLLQMKALFKLPNKKARLEWLGELKVDEPESCAESLRQQVRDAVF